MELKISINGKLSLSAEEQSNVVCTNVGGGQIEISFKTIEAITGVSPFSLTDDELMYLKDRVNFIDQNGMFSADTMPTYVKILDAPFADSEYQKKWNTRMGIESNVSEVK